MKKIFTLAIILVFISMIFVAPVHALFNTSTFNKLSINDIKIKIQQEEALKEAFGDNYKEVLENNWKQVQVAQKVHEIIKEYYGDDVYPSYFGGMYISDDSLSLIIQIVKENIPSKNTEEYAIYEEIINVDEFVTIKYVRYSYDELMNTNDTISEFLALNRQDFEYVSANYIDVRNNKLGIMLEDNNELQQERFIESISSNSVNQSLYTNSKLIDEEMITYSEGSFQTTATELKVGQEVNGNCSMAFRALYNNSTIGYLTAGHCVSGKGAQVATGEVILHQFANNQSYDYAFIQTTSAYIPVDTFFYTLPGLKGLDTPKSCPVLVVGMAIAKLGAATKYTTGKIEDLNVNMYYKDRKITTKNMVLSTVVVDDGDSGGAVFIPKVNLSNPNSSIAAGIVSGKVTDNNGNVTGSVLTSITSLPSTILR